ncbi:FMN-dependent NADPH-azoreductase [Roseivivax sp. THAF40]|uniref:NADPH-dependent FMN reductase n=1 Tax=unclassified Roseivivax TaxID=2639302 RepID=UPI001267F61C|nr:MULTISPECIES: NAD(P)H-dependent oxidoreductase [unclassified Roseivivax]QFS84549.1 FMN-dependent NADPH-azoreductase [Roseivivax sp. THAF197b]QFT48376.1 FMN-dependent NADPH-azoreductase [Roseivivax sp. THAF40]
MSDLKLLTISGSLRKASTNRKLAAEAARRFGPADVTIADIVFPVYDGDLEDQSGIPPEVQTLADQIAEADAVVVSTPEYNKGISGVLKNALDWVSRTEGNPWRDKPVALMSATAGRAGGERTQNMARLCLTPFRPYLLPGPEVLVGNTSKQWDENDRLTDEFAIKLLTELVEDLRAAAEARQR